MADRFYARFNLSRADFLVFKDEFDKLQKERVERLKEEFKNDIEALQNKKVLFIGDSITSDNLGYRISVSLAANLQAVNGSVSSSTSATLLESALRLIEDSKPEIVSIMLGTNDSISMGKPSNNTVTIENYASNMRRIISKAKELGAKVLLFEIPKIHEELFREYFTQRGKFQTNADVEKYNRKLSEIAKENEIPLIRHTWFGNENSHVYFEPDGVHLSESAQELFAKNWLLNVKNLIKEI